MLQKPRNIALGLIGALVLGAPPANAINIAVSPSRFILEISSKKTRSQAVRVVNVDSQPVELKVYVKSWVLNEQNKLELVPSREQSLDQWIVYTPSRFTIPPGGSQTIRFAIRPRVQPQQGEHRAVLYIEEVPTNNAQSKGVQVTGRLGVAIYGYVGDIKRVGLLNAINVDTKSDAVRASFDISSQGNGFVRLNGQYAVWPAAQYPGAEATKPIADLDKPTPKLPKEVVTAGFLPDTPVLPDTRRRILLPIIKKLPPGNYVLDINGELNGVAIQKGIPFTVPVNSPVANNRSSRIQPASQKLRDSLKNSQKRK
ncbi:fimbrial biogenesis chaperone [Fischerella sp. PCC 9605]|uniref:fimbrial biogenesis chaperone n=1 Tax=Fischerella sp. PCC 9605 TaxID=1173024 RepID=UPI00047EF689|nr:fimbria/pilus periplasmic chaperone [Fischerella sp. PCC 9605]